MKIWMKFLAGLMMAILAAAAGGCGPDVPLRQSGETRIVVDDEGTAVRVPSHPKRILSLTSAIDTIMLDIVDPDRMAAVNSLDRYEGFSMSWEKARKVKTVLRDYNIETIVKLKPDLVLVPDYSSENVVSSIRGMGIPVVVINSSTTVDSTFTIIRKLGEVVNEEAAAEALAAKVETDLDKVDEMRARIPKGQERSTVFLSTMNGYAGTGSLYDNMCPRMGIINAPSAMGLPPRTAFTDERIVAMDPDYLFLPVYTRRDLAVVERYYHDPAFSGMKSVRSHTILPLKAAYLYTSNQYIGKSMMAIMRAVYPDIFTEEQSESQGGVL